MLTYYAPARRERASKRCFCPSVRLSVRLSVRSSVAYIANNSRTQSPSLPKFGRKVPHLRCESHTSFKVKRSKIKVARPINADTHPAAYLPNAYIGYCIPLVVCPCLAYFSAISVSICTKLARSILITDRNTVTVPNFRKKPF